MIALDSSLQIVIASLGTRSQAASREATRSPFGPEVCRCRPEAHERMKYPCSAMQPRNTESVDTARMSSPAFAPAKFFDAPSHIALARSNFAGLEAVGLPPVYSTHCSAVLLQPVRTGEPTTCTSSERLPRFHMQDHSTRIERRVSPRHPGSRNARQRPREAGRSGSWTSSAARSSPSTLLFARRHLTYEGCPLARPPPPRHESNRVLRR
jgi:hypothetical protein